MVGRWGGLFLTAVAVLVPAVTARLFGEGHGRATSSRYSRLADHLCDDRIALWLGLALRGWHLSPLAGYSEVCTQTQAFGAALVGLEDPVLGRLRRASHPASAPPQLRLSCPETGFCLDLPHPTRNGPPCHPVHHGTGITYQSARRWISQRWEGPKKASLCSYFMEFSYLPHKILISLVRNPSGADFKNER